MEEASSEYAFDEEGCIVNTREFFNHCLLGKFIQHFCNEVLFDSPGRHFHSEIQHPASKVYCNVTRMNLGFSTVHAVAESEY